MEKLAPEENYTFNAPIINFGKKYGKIHSKI